MPVGADRQLKPHAQVAALRRCLASRPGSRSARRRSNQTLRQPARRNTDFFGTPVGAEDGTDSPDHPFEAICWSERWATQAATPTTKDSSNAAPPDTTQIEQQLHQDLSKAGYTDIKIMPGSFLVQAKDKQGSETEMMISPHSMTEVTAMSAADSSNSEREEREDRDRPTPCMTVCARAPRNLREHELGIFRGYPIMLGAANVSGGQLVHELIRNPRSVLPFS